MKWNRLSDIMPAPDATAATGSDTLGERGVA
jgi:hypothetical protein